MESLEYLNNIKEEYYLTDADLIDILDYLRYIARDNNESRADSFLDSIQEVIDC